MVLLSDHHMLCNTTTSYVRGVDEDEKTAEADGEDLDDECSDVLPRFGDREETVRLKVWATYIALLNQTNMYGGLPQVSDGEYVVGGKWKHESEDTLLFQLKASETAPTTLQAGFQLSPIVRDDQRYLVAVTDDDDTHATSHMSFILGNLLLNTPTTVLTPSFPVLVLLLLKSLGERHPRVASETFRTFSALLNAARPVKNGDWPERVYDHSIQRLSTTDTDTEYLVSQVTVYIGTSDISVLSQALSILAHLLELAPRTSFPLIERDLLSDIYPNAYSPLVLGAALDALLSFFSALVEADDQIATHVVPGPVIAAQKSGGKGDVSSMNVAKCVGEVVRSQQGVAAGTIAEYSKYIEGRSISSLDWVWPCGDKVGEVCLIFLEEFKGEDAERGAKFTYSWRVGAIHVITHCSRGQLEPLTDQIWTPLFNNSISDAEESTRNAAAACLGKLTTTDPGRYPQLCAYIRAENPAIRATQHKVDEGLDARKTAWKTLYTLTGEAIANNTSWLDMLLYKLDLPTFLTFLLPALSYTSDEIKVFAHFPIGRLSSIPLCALLLLARLDVPTPTLETTMKGAPLTKNTVKHALKRTVQVRRSTKKVVVALTKVVAVWNGGSQKLGVLVEDIRKNEQMGPEFRESLG
ncbi:hypothetical protein M404DRAFT_11141 [Pisolithus tinctorius Marx 270]|uniref:TATA-binding protein interacting (TIP20) domain-containing protein n=1 Tax=Pisolithus tinctorius Marx 270 TaxID=870435 RepID=A0A0C3NIC2_PISTI|nr:hypothetical protein M404DRAFT_11141 [Pisolithus tinctorius Marx 270]